MDYPALKLSLILAGCTALILLPISIILAHTLCRKPVSGKNTILALITLPLVLPPTVLGYYLLVIFSRDYWAGDLWFSLFSQPLLFSFEGLLIASAIFNLPFMFQPIYLAFKSIPPNIREAAWCCGMSTWKTFLRIELPLAWPGILSAIILTIAHTLGEFGVVLMVGGNIPDETRTLSISIYDRVQMFDHYGAGVMSAVLLVISMGAIIAIYYLNDRFTRQHNG
ncbi:MAG: molybdate ABC transporter permease subunit [Thiotrichales bacterium]|nr:molybdate ABC transporter permease subunit [Thiotrichales bacterium]